MWIDNIDLDKLVTNYGKLKPIKGLALGGPLKLEISTSINKAIRSLKDEDQFENFVDCHMKQLNVYLMPLICNEYRVPESWSINIPIDVSYDEIKTIISNYIEEYYSEQPYRLKFKNIVIVRNKLCMNMEAADIETSHTLNALSDFALNTLGFRILSLEKFQIRVHLGLWYSQNLNNFNADIDQLIGKLTQELNQNVEIVSLDGAKLLEHKTLFELEEIKITPQSYVSLAE